MNVQRILGILPKNKKIYVFKEYSQELLFEGVAYMLDSKYILSLLVTDVWATPFDVYISVVEV